MNHRSPHLDLEDAVPPRLALQRQRIPEELAGSLRERILSGELQEGSLLRQEAVAAQYRVSRIPVREAFRLLAGEGLIDLRQAHRGAVVAALSPEQIGELFDLRALLERDLVVRAVPRATSADIAAAEEVLRRVDAAYAERDADAWGTLNAEFHRALCLPAGREQTMAIVDHVGQLTRRAVRLYHRLITAFDAAHAEHWEILRLYRARRAEQAGAALARHVDATKQALIEVLEGRRAAPAASARSCATTGHARRPRRRARPA